LVGRQECSLARNLHTGLQPRFGGAFVARLCAVFYFEQTRLEPFAWMHLGGGRRGMPCLLLPSAENEPHRKPLKPNSNHATKEGFAPPLKVGSFSRT
jgi:hypothetical protein